MEEEVLQQEMLSPREMRSNYYYRLLENVKLNRDNFKYDREVKWDDGYTMDEIIDWLQNDGDIMNGRTPRAKMREEVAKVLRKNFHMENILRRIPADKRLLSEPENNRKWRYVGTIDWDQFIDGLDD